MAAGKHIWEKNSCINCHTILGEGAYFAPEVGNVMKRWGVQDDPVAATEMLKAWMQSMPTGIAGRRQMPKFELTDEEYRNFGIDFGALGFAGNRFGMPRTYGLDLVYDMK